MGDVDDPGMDQNGISIINGEYEATHVGYHDDYGWGGANGDMVDRQYQGTSSVFNFGMNMMVMLLEVQHTQIAHLLHHGKDLE